MAKGLEDTTFYRYNRHIALNEVGGEPYRFGLTVAQFHRANVTRARDWPHSMLGTSTHDTKRGEDTRARLAVLSDLPEEWTKQVTTWSRLLRARRGDLDGSAPPDRNDEYMLFQLMIGSWPIELLDDVHDDALDAYRGRLAGALEKSLREAKLHSSWASPDTAYEDAMRGFMEDALETGRGSFMSTFLPFAAKIARLGVQNSLVQTALKLTLPGVPDIYQGCDLWDLSLMDPDNRRPVDYELREGLLAALETRLEATSDRSDTMRHLFEEWPDGRIKLALTTILLRLRTEHAPLFKDGSYEPVSIEGRRANWALGYVRRTGQARLVVIAARFPGSRETDPGWGGTEAAVPEGDWVDVLTLRGFRGGALALETVLDTLPVAVLLSR